MKYKKRIDRLLSTNFRPEPYHLLALVAYATDYNPDDLITAGRKRDKVICRNIFYYLAVKYNLPKGKIKGLTGQSYWNVSDACSNVQTGLTIGDKLICERMDQVLDHLKSKAKEFETVYYIAFTVDQIEEIKNLAGDELSYYLGCFLKSKR